MIVRFPHRASNASRGWFQSSSYGIGNPSPKRYIFWQRVNASEEPFRIEPVTEHYLKPGEMLISHPNAIHQAESVGQDISLTFQLYGDTQPKSRFQFEPNSQTARRF